MINFSNGREAEYFIASGALGFDGNGWPWEWPLRWLGLIDPKLFTVVGKSIGLHPRKGNLNWLMPWECFQPIEDGFVNKIDLTNMGFIVFYEKILPSVANFVVSLFGSEEELLCMVGLLEEETLAGIELNPSCPNRNVVEDTETIIQTTKVVHAKTHHPVILKLSVIQDYIAIASGVVGYAEAISLNSVPWEIAFPGKPSPLAKLQKRVSGGGGGVSGKAAQPFNWEAVRNLKMFVPEMPVIAPSIWTFKDIAYVRDELRADGISFGAVHARYGFLGSILPTLWVRKLIRGRRIHENGR